MQLLTILKLKGCAITKKKLSLSSPKIVNQLLLKSLHNITTAALSQSLLKSDSANFKKKIDLFVISRTLESLLKSLFTIIINYTHNHLPSSLLTFFIYTGTNLLPGVISRHYLIHEIPKIKEKYVNVQTIQHFCTHNIISD